MPSSLSFVRLKNNKKIQFKIDFMSKVLFFWKLRPSNLIRIQSDKINYIILKFIFLSSKL